MNAWERMMAEAEAGAKHAAQQRQARQDKADRAAVAFERVGSLARSIDVTIAAGLRDPNLDNKPRLQQLRNALDEAQETVDEGRTR